MARRNELRYFTGAAIKKQKILIYLSKVAIVILFVVSMTIHSYDNNLTNIAYNSLNVTDIIINPHNTNVLYVGIDRNGLYRSVDMGKSWIYCSMELPNHIIKIAFDPIEKVVYAGTLRGLFASYDGDNWTKLEDFAVHDIFIQPTEPSKIYIHGVSPGLIVSSIEHTWEGINTPVKQVFLLPVATDPFDSGIIYFTMNRFDRGLVIYDGWNDGGIYKSSDYGKTMEKVNSLKSEIFLISSRNTSVMYGTEENTILKSINRGASFKEIKTMESPIRGLIINPLDNNILYAVTDYYRYTNNAELDFSLSRIFKSIDAGETWQKISDFPANKVVMDPFNPDILYAGTPGAGILKSTDAGKTWKVSNSGIKTSEGINLK